MRLSPIAEAEMSAAQREVLDEARSGRRGATPAPLAAWLRSPEMARHAQRLGESVRYDLRLPARLVALAALTVAVHWKAPYVRGVQSAKARAEGVPGEAVDAILAGGSPHLADPADAAIHAAVRTLLDARALDDATYAHLAGTMGERGLVELVAAVGYYGTVAMTDAVFGIGPRSGEAGERR